VVVLILPLLITPYVARVLGAHQLGIYDYANSIVTLIYTLGLLGIGHYGNRECAYTRDDKEELSETFWSILAIQIILGFFSLLFSLNIMINVLISSVCPDHPIIINDCPALFYLDILRSGQFHRII